MFDQHVIRESGVKVNEPNTIYYCSKKPHDIELRNLPAGSACFYFQWANGKGSFECYGKGENNTDFSFTSAIKPASWTESQLVDEFNGFSSFTKNMIASEIRKFIPSKPPLFADDKSGVHIGVDGEYMGFVPHRPSR